MPEQKVFLRAEWRNLLIANYTCDPAILQPYLPAKTVLDTYKGEHLVSLVAFQFLNTAVMGIKFPFHTNFVEINLRLYVKHQDNGEWKRGVVFVKEIVPRSMITFVANTLFNENYITMPTAGQISKTADVITANYTWGKASKFAATAQLQTQAIAADTIEEFITEHYWGYAAIDAAQTHQYGVEHPRWNVHPLINYSIQTNFETLYGSNFAFINEAQPHSVLFAAGSPVLVRKGYPIT